MSECTKVKYADKITAELDIAKIKKRSTRDVIPVRAYLCPMCKAWHLTSKPDPKALFERVGKLEDTVVALSKELAGFKQSVVVQVSPQEKATILKEKQVAELLAKDKQIEKLKAEVVTLRKKVSELRNDNHNYIAKNFSLQNKIKLLESK